MAMDRSLDGGNRSLVRGLEILRAFRPGVEVLGNGEISERTGLPRATVSRLAHTLVQIGVLDYVRPQRAFRLSASVLTFGHAFQVGSPILTAIGPLMRAEAHRQKVNIGLATADRNMMVYLESVRPNARIALRTVAAGQQVPMELTSLGRAYLAGLSDTDREPILRLVKRRSIADTKRLLAAIDASIESVRFSGYCAASWQPGVLAVAAPIFVRGLAVHAINMSVQDVRITSKLTADLGQRLLSFVAKCSALVDGSGPLHTAWVARAI